MVAHKSPMNRFQDPLPNTLRDQMMIFLYLGIYTLESYQIQRGCPT